MSGRAPFQSPQLNTKTNPKISTITTTRFHATQQSDRMNRSRCQECTMIMCICESDEEAEATEVYDYESDLEETSMTNLARFKTSNIDWVASPIEKDVSILDRKYFNKPSLDYVENCEVPIFEVPAKQEDALMSEQDLSDVDDLEEHIPMKRTYNARMGDDDEELSPRKPTKRNHKEVVTNEVDIGNVTSTKKAKGNQGLKTQRWCFTWNNPSVEGDVFKKHLEETKQFRLGVFQLEKGENGTPHFQGYVELEEKKRCYVSAMHKLCAPHKMTWLYAEAPRANNERYCTKLTDTKSDGEEFVTRIEGPWYLNDDKDAFKAKARGKRTDLDKFAQLVLEQGGINQTVVDEMPGHAVQFGRNAAQLVHVLALKNAEEEEDAYWVEQAAREDRGEEVQGQQQRHLELYFGPTACGKTTRIKLDVIGRRRLRLYTKNCGNKWWCGYDTHDAVLLDEFRGDSFGKMEDFNNLTNLGALQVECKGGNTVMLAQEMHIASNRHPCHWWKKNQSEHYGWDDGRYQAVVRRFAKVHWWNGDHQYVTLVNPGIKPERTEVEAYALWRKQHHDWRRFWMWDNRQIVEGDAVHLDQAMDYYTLAH
ncbi:MAG: putative viral replication protein [Cressdnaviricota sp.]|nr:MAG: putative viral replication protein [Cressdnaviricota sp.]